MSINSVGIIDHEFVIDHPATDVTEARFQWWHLDRNHRLH